MSREAEWEMGNPNEVGVDVGEEVSTDPGNEAIMSA